VKPAIRCNKNIVKILAVATTMVALYAVTDGPAVAQQADLVLRNGVIWTVDEDNPRAAAVATLGDKTVYVGSDQGVSKYIINDV